MEELDELNELVEENSQISYEDDTDFDESAYIFETNTEEVIKPGKSTLVDELLKNKGIKDSKIKIIDEDNTETEVSFYDLSREEQLEILNPKVEEIQTPSKFGQEEEAFFNYLKENKLTVAEYLQKYKEATISEVESGFEPTYDIDTYGDEELFLLDLKTKYDLTDEELEKELVKAQDDPDLFKKKTTKLRQEYKELEDAYKADEQNKSNLKKEEEYNSFVQTMVDVATKNSELYGIELEDNEKNEVLSYLLELDENGTSNFYKQLNSPDKLYEAAWFLKYGKEAFEAFENVIDGYQKEIKKLKDPNKSEKVVIKKTNNKERSIYELN